MHPNTKEPEDKYKVWKDSRPDFPTLSGIFSEHRDSNWAVYCVGGYTGLDFDCPETYLKFFEDLDTLTTRSPSGGYHVILKSLIKAKTFKSHGLEIRVDEPITILGTGYELVKDLPVKEIEDVGEFVKKKLPKLKISKESHRLKDIKIGNVIIKFTEKKKEGHNYWTAFCPIHGDTKTPHLYVYEETNSWYCFKCKKGGDVIEFIKQLEDLDYNEALSKLEELLGIKLQSKVEKGIKFYSVYEFPDGRYAEEILKDGIPIFLIYDPKTGQIEYQEKIEHDNGIILPIPLDPKLKEALTLPDGVEEYGTLEQLINDIIDFALAKFDPVSNLVLFVLIIYIFLASWFVPKWMRNYPERFFPIVSPRGPSETGKKRVLTIARWITYRPLYFLKTTKVPTLFRALDPWQGTIVMDEADINDTSEAADYIEFLNSRADGVPIPRYSAEGKTTEWWFSFGLTIIATRKPYTDDGAESRTIVFPTESTNNPEKYDLIPTKEWMEKGKQLQRKLLLFRLRHLDGKIPNNLIIPSVRGFRVRECLLSLQVLSEEYPKIIENLKEIAIVLEKRLIAERAASREGLILNVIYSEIEDGAELIQKDTGWYVLKITGKENEKKETAVNLKFVSKALGETFPSAEIGRIWRGLGQEIKEQMRTSEGTRFKRVLFITNPKRLEREFKKYVPDAVDVLDTIYSKKGISDFAGKSSGSTNQSKDDYVPSVPFVPSESISEIEKRIEQSRPEWEHLNNKSVISNLVAFSIWFCENKDKSKLPAEIYTIAKKVFKTASVSDNDKDWSEQRGSQSQSKELGTLKFAGKAIPIIWEEYENDFSRL